MKIKKLILSLLIWSILLLTHNLNAQAITDFETVNISLGNAQGELKFIPNKFDFKAGQKYKLILDNPSPEKHYFTAKDFADASWTQKIQAGKVEIKGAIHELELKPEGTADWVFIPQKEGIYQLYCSIKGHKEAGMIGEIAIRN